MLKKIPGSFFPSAFNENVSDFQTRANDHIRGGVFGFSFLTSEKGKHTWAILAKHAANRKRLK